MGRRRVCRACKAPLTQPKTGRPREFCSRPCRQRTYKRERRRRLRAAAADRSHWYTPEPLRAAVRAAFPNLSLDVAAVRDSAVCLAYLGPDQADPSKVNALAPSLDWAELAGEGGCCWMNPPFQVRQLQRFLAKAVQTAARCDVVGLVPASPCSAWWRTWVRDAGARWEWIPGRLAFDGPHSRSGNVAPMGVALVHWPARVGEFPAGGETVLLAPEAAAAYEG